jgi:predicted dehydrogenase
MRTGKVRIGIIGTSWWTDLMYVPSLNRHPDAEVVAVCGRDRKRAEAIAAKFGSGKVFDDYRALIASGACEAVIVATPDDLHRDMVLAALDAKLHVLCEKPLAGNATDALLMLERAKAAGVCHMVLFTWRWQPHWRYVKQLVESGYVGKCRYAEFRFLASFALDPGYKWRFDGRRANGVVGDLGSHMIDFAEWILGRASAVRADVRTFVDQSATASPPPLPANDAGFLNLAFADQSRADIVVSAVSHLGDEGVRIAVSIYGDEGSLEVEHPYFGVRAGPTIRGCRRGDAAFAPIALPPEVFDGGVDRGQIFDPYLKQTAGPRLFVEAVRDGRPAEPDFSVGVRVQEIVDAALLSATEDRWVSVA